MTVRHLPFERGVNFRDMGGYATADGRKTKWRRLFRCGLMSQLSDADLLHLESLELSAICDFRGEKEYTANPSRVPESLRSRVHQLTIVPSGHFDAGNDVLALIKGERTAEELRAKGGKAYRRLARDCTAVYTDMFRHLLAAEGRAMLIHCVGGKDRTGVGSALILSALGVPERTIVEDYMLTNESPPLRLWLGSMLDRYAAEHPLPQPREEFLDVMMTRCARWMRCPARRRTTCAKCWASARPTSTACAAGTWKASAR
jgi:protein-tyrosine phosphatase